MRKKVDFKIFLGVCVLLVAGLSFYFLEIYNPADTNNYEQVIVAKQNIEPNTLITRDMLATQKRVSPNPERFVINELTQLEGKRALSLIVEGETIKTFRVGEDSPRFDIATDNVREMAIPINQIDSSLEIKEGSYIDILGRPSNELRDPEIILSGKKVLYMNTSEGTRIKSSNEGRVSTVVILVNFNEYQNYVLKTSKFGSLSPDILSYGVLEDESTLTPFNLQSSFPKIDGIVSVTENNNGVLETTTFDEEE